MKTKNVYLANKNSFTDLSLPLLWCTLKTYFEENSTKSNEFNWADPWIADYRTKEEILYECHKSPPDVFGFSVYVWNESFFDDVAKEVKQQFPNCLIVYGGPQPNVKYNQEFFKQKPWIDIVVPGDAYGEIVFKEILDHYPITDYEKIPYIYYSDKDRNCYFSQQGIEKKSFKWPKNVYKAQEKYLLPHVGKLAYSLLETSRGCPYQCIYCDWGGGTYTKVNKKPLDIVLDEIEWVGAHKINFLGITDANFGIYDIDFFIAEHLVDVAKKHGYPKNVLAENAKNHLERTTKIKELLLEHNLLDHYKISIQAIDQEIKDNIRRIDPPIEKQIETVNYLKSKFPNLTVMAETISGLPGDNYQKTLDQMNILINNGINEARSHTWILLPETPAFSPESRKKFQIQTVPKTWPANLWWAKPDFQGDAPVILSYNGDWENPSVETVVGTYSYSKEEWIDMFLVSALIYTTTLTGINSTLCVYMKQSHNIEPSIILDHIYKNYIKPNLSNTNSLLANKLAVGHQTIYKWIHDEHYIPEIDFHPEFPFYLSPAGYIALVALTNAKLFYNTICNDLSIKFTDSALIDLGEYLANSVLDSEYDPDIGRKFSTKYNWLKYFKTKELDQGLFTYQVTDQTVFIEHKDQKINWHQYKENMGKHYTQYFYQSLLTKYDKLSKTIELYQ